MRIWTSEKIFNCILNSFLVKRIHCSVQNFKDKNLVEIDFSQFKIETSAKRTPKNGPSHLRAHRTLKRQKNSDSISSSIYFQIVGNGEVDGARGLLLRTDHNQYLFNCGEGIQRLATEECASSMLGNLGDIFFTSRTWKNLGGFPGICLTIRTSGAPGVRVHGPDKCMALFDSVKDFISLSEFDVLYQSGNKMYEDTNIKVHKVPLSYNGPEILPNPSKFGIWSAERTDALTKNGEPINILHISITKKKEKKAIDATAIAYLLTLKSKPCKSDFEKCTELKVPHDPLLGKLKAGEDICFGENIMVKANNVILPKLEEQKALIIECPNEHYLEPLLNNKRLNEDINQDELLEVVFHFTPKLVMQTECYRKWMEGFKQKNLKHILVNDEDPGLCNNVFIRHTKKLRMVAPAIFPKIWDVSRKDITKEKKNYNTVIGKSGMQYHLRPNSGISVSEEVPPFDEEIIEDKVKKKIGVPNLLEQAHKKMVLDTSKSEYPKFTFLGTGCSVPNKYRNVSCILVETKPDNFIMLDCGEGSLLQLYRHFGRERGVDILKKVKGIYISHLHADHHLGLVNIIQQRSKNLEGDEAKKLYIIAPSMLSNFLILYDCEFEPILEHAVPIRNEHLILDCAKSTNFKSQRLYPHILQQLLEYTGLKSIYTCKADHSYGSYCVAFTTDQNFKVVYTGDTRPIQTLIDIGRHDKSPDLLIHEATVEHLALRDAIRKRHSTFIEAVKEGHDMGASFTILTHFSLKYQKIPPFDEFRNNSDVAVAFDHLSVNPQTFHLGYFMYPSLEKIFSQKFRSMERNRTSADNEDPASGSTKDAMDTHSIKKQKLE